MLLHVAQTDMHARRPPPSLPSILHCLSSFDAPVLHHIATPAQRCRFMHTRVCARMPICRVVTGQEKQETQRSHGTDSTPSTLGLLLQGDPPPPALHPFKPASVPCHLCCHRPQAQAQHHAGCCHRQQNTYMVSAAIALSRPQSTHGTNVAYFDGTNTILQHNR